MLLVTSCCKWCPPIEKTVEVKIPVPVSCPAPPVFEKVVDPVLSFTDSVTIEQKIKDLRASRVLWRERAKQQEVLLDSYRQNVAKEKLYFGNYSGSK
jgi:hypothetical protein